MTAQELIKVRAFVRSYIAENGKRFKSENVETGSIPNFLVYASRGNDRETLNLYFDYKTSKQFINRAILSLGHWHNFPNSTVRDLESLAVLCLNDLGIEAIRAKNTYQSEEQPCE